MRIIKKKNKNKKTVKNKEKDKEKEKYNNIDFDIDIEDDNNNDEAFSSNLNNNSNNEFYSESSLEPLNTLDKLYEKDKKMKENLEKKRERSDISSEYSISIDDPNMKTDNTSQNCSHLNHLFDNCNNKCNICNNSNNNNKSRSSNSNNSSSNNHINEFLRISQVQIPSKENDPISLVCKMKNKEKEFNIIGARKSLNIPKEEIIKSYEMILKNYLGGKTVNFQ